MTIDEFGKKIKAKYPEYSDISDAELGQKMLSKYPEYSDLIDDVPSAPQTVQKSGLQKTSDFVSKIFPGQKIGQGIGTSIAATIQDFKGNHETAKTLMASAPSVKQMIGDAVGAGTFAASVAVPGAATIGGKIAQIGGLSALSGAAGSAAGGGDFGDIIKSAFISGTIGAGLGAIIGGVGKGVQKLTKKAPSKIMNTAVKTPLQDTKKAIMYGGDTLGDDLVKRGITGSDEKLFETAIKQIEKNEDELQNILLSSSKTIKRTDLSSYLDDLIKAKEQTPGLLDDVEKVNEVLKQFPEEVPIAQANQIKRNLYKALTDVAFKVDPNLTSKKEAMKAIASGIKTEIEKKTADEVGEGVVKAINKELSVFGKLQDRALDKIARANKNNLLGLGDMFALGTGAAAGAATGGSAIVGAGIVEGIKRAAGSTSVMSRVAVSLDKLGKAVEKLPVDKAGRISKAALSKLIQEISRSQK